MKSYIIRSGWLEFLLILYEVEFFHSLAWSAAFDLVYFGSKKLTSYIQIWLLVKEALLVASNLAYALSLDKAEWVSNFAW